MEGYVNMCHPFRPLGCRNPLPSSRKNVMPVFFGRAIVCLCLTVLLFPAGDARAGGPDRAFSPGEKLTFQIKWGNVPAGEAVLEVLPVEMRGGTPVYHFAMQVKTNAFLDLFYYYRNRVDAYAELQMNRSLLFRQSVKTSRKTKNVTVDFDWQANLAHFQRTEAVSHTKQEPHVKTLQTPLLPGTFDPLSAFYYTRRLALQEGVLVERPVSDGKRALRANLKVIGRETITLNGRSYDTFLVQPDLKGVNPVFEKEAGAAIQIWVSADAYRIPIKLKSKVRIGSFTGELVDVEGVQGYGRAAADGTRISDARAGAPVGVPGS